MLLPESPSPVHDQAVVLTTRQNPAIDPETQRRKDIEEFRLNLPITSYKEEIERLLDDQTFIIVTGETGSGKSTQLPQYVMDSQNLKEILKKARLTYYQQIDENREKEREKKEKVIEVEKDIKDKGIEIEKDLNENEKDHKENENEKDSKDHKDNKDHKEKEKERTKGQEQPMPQHKRVLEDRRNADDMKIAVTQPRRMAAISMAKRLCFERNEVLGQNIGYSIRFDNMTSDTTKLRYLTDGILVRECLQDRDLCQYDVIILDEAHERSLYTDVLFALVKGAAERRMGSLRVIITSATLNVALFRNYFNECPLVKVHGKSYQVEVKCSEQPIGAIKRTNEAVTAALRMHLHEGPGDILVFLPGSEDCEVARKLCYERLEEILNAGREVPNVLLYTLYGSQSSEDQSVIFQNVDEDTRKIIFCTNIAETSITIDNIGFVIDSGYVKQKTYNPRTGMDSLLITPISKTQSIQRMGRAGRTQAGKCFRLYTKQFYDHMSEHSIAEILRVNLSSVLLLLKTMGIDDVARFEFIEMPSQQSMLQSLRQLYLLGAINETGYITPMGIEMSRYPLEPSYAKAMITSKLIGCHEEMSIIVALLSTENVWTRVTKVDQEGFQRFWLLQEHYADIQGDHQTLLKIFNLWKSNGMSEQFAKDNMLNYRALRTAENIRVQLLQMLELASLRRCMQYYEQDHLYKMYKKNCGGRDRRDSYRRDSYHSQRNRGNNREQCSLPVEQLIKMALCTGFYFNCARRMANSEDSYLMIYPEGTVVSVDVSSVYAILGKYPNCVVFTELGGTSLIQGMMKLVTEIEIEWVKPYFPMMVKVDLFKLARIEFQQDRQESVIEKKAKREQDAKKKQEDDEQKKKDKIEQYKLAYIGRKKVKQE